MLITFLFFNVAILAKRRDLGSDPLVVQRLGVMLSVVLFNDLSVYISVVSALRMKSFWDQPASPYDSGLSFEKGLMA